MKVSDVLGRDIKIAQQELVILELQAKEQFTKLITKRDTLVEQAKAEVGAPSTHDYNIDTYEFTERVPASPVVGEVLDGQVRPAPVRVGTRANHRS